MSEDEKDDKDDKSDKPMFIARCIAFLFDAFLVLLLSTFIATPFVNSEKIISLADDSRELIEKYQKKEITENEYVVEVSNLEYQIATNMELVTLVGIFIGLLYYVVLPIYNNGQTLGKKIMKMKIISTLGDLNANQLVFRCFVANSILLNLISVLFIMFASRDVYTTCVEMFTFAQYIIIAISIMNVIVSKNGLAIHDALVHTKVVKMN